MTHADLVKRAGRWLRNTRKCKLVILEPKPWNCHEHVDAIGWTPLGDSIVVECKIAVTDFGRDGRKHWRLTTIGMGAQRYYLTPPGLINPPEQVHKIDLCGTGIIEAHGRVVKVISEADTRPLHDFVAETNLLVAHICGKLSGKHEREER